MKSATKTCAFQLFQKNLHGEHPQHRSTRLHSGAKYDMLRYILRGRSSGECPKTAQSRAAQEGELQMVQYMEWLKAFLFGIVEGITEWLPISSTGHMILLNEFVKLDVSDAFYKMFEVVIQLGAILAVVVLFWNQIWPLKRNHGRHGGASVTIDRDIIRLWCKIVVACVSYLAQVAGRKLKFGVGVLYQGSSYKNTHDTGADKILMHYMAPQVSLTMVKKHYQLQLAGGIGYQFYKDKSKVYGKPRDVSMDKLAGNLTLSGEYFLTSHWGASARLNWLASSTETYSVKYHDEKWNVENPKTGTGYFGQLSLVFGLNYHF